MRRGTLRQLQVRRRQAELAAQGEQAWARRAVRGDQAGVEAVAGPGLAPLVDVHARDPRRQASEPEDEVDRPPGAAHAWPQRDLARRGREADDAAGLGQPDLAL